MGAGGGTGGVWALWQPHHLRGRGPCGCAIGRRGGGSHVFRYGRRHKHVALTALCRRSPGDHGRFVSAHPAVLFNFPQALGDRVFGGPGRRPGAAGGRHPSRNQSHRLRVTHQPLHEGPGSRTARGYREASQGQDPDRQHFRYPHQSAAARIWRRPGGGFGHEVPRWPQ